jgi:predicted DNA-binding transcriptional regulator AlpA
VTPDHAIIEAIRQVAQIPTERRLWSVDTIAAYSGLSKSHVAQKIVVQPDFPTPIRVSDNAHPRWISGEVMAWFESRKAA